MTTSKVDPKIIILLFLAKEPKAEVMKDFSVSLTSISLLDENKFNKEGNNKNVTPEFVVLWNAPYAELPKYTD